MSFDKAAFVEFLLDIGEAAVDGFVIDAFFIEFGQQLCLFLLILRDSFLQFLDLLLELAPDL